jgi:hypothetical protein
VVELEEVTDGVGARPLVEELHVITGVKEATGGVEKIGGERAGAHDGGQGEG